MCKENMELYQKFRACPKEAQKPITAGRLKGKTDINPMWRLKMLTEAFGPCGFGWTTTIVRTWIDEGEGGERTANVEIALRYKHNGEWSEPIPGIGGSMLVAKESGGLRTEDECYKKAYTDAISVACKALGIAADIYFEKDPDSKYPTGDTTPGAKTEPTRPKNAPGAQTVAPTKRAFSYPAILDEKLAAGIYAGKTWREVYKTDRDYIQNFPLQTDVTDDMIEIVGFINAEINKANAARAAGGVQ